jgi:hypothetical protein
LNIDEPATSTSAPAFTSAGAVAGVNAAVDFDMDRTVAEHRLDRAPPCRSDSGMKLWPPKPGLTLITSTRSTMSST